MTLVLSALAGLLIGFIAHDLAIQALRDQSLRPLGGTCPKCGSTRGWLKYRCPDCGRGVRREAIVGCATAGAAVGFALAVGVSWVMIPYAGFLLLTTALAITDVDAMRIVDRLNLRGSISLIGLLGLASLADNQLEDYGRALVGGLAYFAGALLLFLVVRGKGFGAGDVKLAPLLGAFSAYLGWGVLGRSVLATAVVGGALAVFALLFMAAKRDTELPYGPAMILGAWLAIVLVGIGA